MKETTQSRTLWSQSMFDSLLVALRRQHADTRVRGLIADLERKGYTLSVIAAKVVRAQGPRAAARVRQLAGTPAPYTPTARQPHRVSRSRRFRNWCLDARDSVEDAMDGMRRLLRRS